MEESVNGVSADEDSANDVDDIFACPPSCAKMEEVLKQIPRSADADLPLSQLFDSAEIVMMFFLCILRLC